MCARPADMQRCNDWVPQHSRIGEMYLQGRIRENWHQEWQHNAHLQRWDFPNTYIYYLVGVWGYRMIKKMIIKFAGLLRLFPSPLFVSNCFENFPGFYHMSKLRRKPVVDFSLGPEDMLIISKSREKSTQNYYVKLDCPQWMWKPSGIGCSFMVTSPFLDEKVPKDIISDKIPVLFVATIDHIVICQWKCLIRFLAYL